MRGVIDSNTNQILDSAASAGMTDTGSLFILFTPHRGEDDCFADRFV